MEKGDKVKEEERDQERKQWGRLCKNCTRKIHDPANSHSCRLSLRSGGMKERKTSVTGRPSCISDIVTESSTFDDVTTTPNNVKSNFVQQQQQQQQNPSKSVETSKTFVNRATGKMLKWLRKNFGRRRQVSIMRKG